jgi:hypothetical protein
MTRNARRIQRKIRRKNRTGFWDVRWARILSQSQADHDKADRALVTLHRMHRRFLRTIREQAPVCGIPESAKVELIGGEP